MIYFIGVPGLIPFYLCFYNIDLIFLEFDKEMFVIYSSVILSFLGAVYWGLYLTSKNKVAIIFSVTPCIYVFFVLAYDLKFESTLWYFMFGYLTVLGFDFYFYFREKIIKTNYFILRIILTTGIVPVHLLLAV
ncbi:DUF3429 domain-containing protein [Alphaproteobacteria bacterium]|nr:DUF3429 domain-containing protein [Alphaproteobacteria bacterium]